MPSVVPPPNREKNNAQEGGPKGMGAPSKSMASRNVVIQNILTKVMDLDHQASWTTREDPDPRTQNLRDT